MDPLTRDLILARARERSGSLALALDEARKSLVDFDDAMTHGDLSDALDHLRDLARHQRAAMLVNVDIWTAIEAEDAASANEARASREERPPIETCGKCGTVFRGRCFRCPNGRAGQ